MGELTALPRPPSWFRGWAPVKEGGREVHGEERRDERGSWTPQIFR